MPWATLYPIVRKTKVMLHYFKSQEERYLIKILPKRMKQKIRNKKQIFIITTTSLNNKRN